MKASLCCKVMLPPRRRSLRRGTTNCIGDGERATAAWLRTLTAPAEAEDNSGARKAFVEADALLAKSS